MTSSNKSNRERDRFGLSSDKYDPESLRLRQEMLEKIDKGFSDHEGYKKPEGVIARHKSSAPVIKRDDVIQTSKRKPSKPVPLYGERTDASRTKHKDESLVEKVSSFFQINAYANDTQAKKRLSLSKISEAFTKHMYQHFSMRENQVTLDELLGAVQSKKIAQDPKYSHITFLPEYLNLLTQEEHVKEVLQTTAFDPYRKIVNSLKHLFPPRHAENDKILDSTLGDKPLRFTSPGIHSLLVQYYKPLYELKLNFSEKEFPRRMSETIKLLGKLYRSARPYIDDEITLDEPQLNTLLETTFYTMTKAFNTHNQIMYAVLLKNKKSSVFYPYSDRKGHQTESSVSHICSLLNVTSPQPNFRMERFPKKETLDETLKSKVSKWEREKKLAEQELLDKEQSQYLSKAESYGYLLLDRLTGRNFDYIRTHPKDIGLTQSYRQLHNNSTIQKTYLLFKFFTFEFMPFMMDNKRQLSYATDHQTEKNMRDALQSDVQELHELDYAFERFFSDDLSKGHAKEANDQDMQSVFKKWYPLKKKLTKTMDQIFADATELYKGVPNSRTRSEYIENLGDTYTFPEASYLSDPRIKKLNNIPIKQLVTTFTSITAFFRRSLKDGYLSVSDDRVYYYDDTTGDHLESFDVPDLSDVVYQKSPAYKEASDEKH